MVQWIRTLVGECNLAMNKERERQRVRETESERVRETERERQRERDRERIFLLQQMDFG